MERRARLLFGALIFDPRAVTTFTLDDQRFIASWATKVHLTYRLGMNPGDRPSEAEMRGFYDSRSPTADSITSIASWVGAATRAFADLRALRQRVHFTRNSSDEGQNITSSWLTLRIGHFVVQNIVVTPPQKGGVVAVNLRSEFRQSALPIYPPIEAVASWPPAERLDDSSFDAFAATYDVPWYDWPLTR